MSDLTNLNPDNNNNFLEVFGADVDINESAQKMIDQIGVGYVRDPDEMVIRQFGNGKVRGAHATTQFCWSLPGKESRNEVWREVLAVKGFIIKSKNGLVLWQENDQESKVKEEGAKSAPKGPVCQSISCTFGDLELNGAKPYPFPDFYSPQEYQVDNTPIVDMETKFNFVGKRGLTCAECVRRGDHQEGKSYCAINGSIVFAVTHYGEEDFDGNFVWNEITKFPSRSATGEPMYKEPVLVHIPISKTAYYKSTEVESSATLATSIVPPDAVSFRKFWLQLAKQNKILSINDVITPTYWLSEVEMYLAEPKSSDAPTKSVPVFRETDTDLRQDKDKLIEYKTCIDLYHSLVSTYCTENNYSLGNVLDHTNTFTNKGVKMVTPVESTTSNEAENGHEQNGKNFKVWSR